MAPTRAPAAAVATVRRAARIDVRKTYKLYIGGRLPALRSGRSYVVDGRRRRRRSPTPAAPRARTSATRSGPRATRSSRGPAATAMNRGQVLYRVAELMEGRRDQFVGEVAAAEGAARGRAPATLVDRAIDRWVWYAGWADKIAQVLGIVEPGRGARTSTSRSPSRPGSSGIVAPESSSLLGLVSRLAPAARRAATSPSCSPPSRGRCRPSR